MSLRVSRWTGEPICGLGPKSVIRYGEQDERAVDAERARERVAHALRLALERKMELGRMQAFDHHRKVAVVRSNADGTGRPPVTSPKDVQSRLCHERGPSMQEDCPAREVALSVNLLRSSCHRSYPVLDRCLPNCDTPYFRRRATWFRRSTRVHARFIELIGELMRVADAMI